MPTWRKIATCSGGSADRKKHFSNSASRIRKLPRRTKSKLMTRMAELEGPRAVRKAQLSHGASHGGQVRQWIRGSYTEGMAPKHRRGVFGSRIMCRRVSSERKRIA